METLVLQQELRFRQAELGVRINENVFQKFFRFSATFAGAVLLSGVAIFGANSPSVPKAHEIVVPFVATTSTASSTIPLVLGINIANNGSIFVRGASVTAIFGDTIQVSVSWGAADFAWAVKTSGTTRFFGQQGQKQTISSLQVGDIVSITGKLTSDSEQPAINAEFVRI